MTIGGTDSASYVDALLHAVGKLKRAARSRNPNMMTMQSIPLMCGQIRRVRRRPSDSRVNVMIASGNFAFAKVERREQNSFQVPHQFIDQHADILRIIDRRDDKLNAAVFERRLDRRAEFRRRLHAAAAGAV